jgi:hypothetical protein
LIQRAGRGRLPPRPVATLIILVPHPATATDRAQDDSPPILGTWRNVYLTVLLHLAAWILLLQLFTARYRPDAP